MVKRALAGLLELPRSSPHRCAFSHSDAVTCFGVAVNAIFYCTYTQEFWLVTRVVGIEPEVRVREDDGASRMEHIQVRVAQLGVLGSDSHSLPPVAPSTSVAPSPPCGLLPAFRVEPSFSGGTFPASALAAWCGERPPSPCKAEHKAQVKRVMMSLLRCNDVPSHMQ